MKISECQKCKNFMRYYYLSNNYLYSTSEGKCLKYSHSTIKSLKACGFYCEQVDKECEKFLDLFSNFLSIQARIDKLTKEVSN